MPVYRCNRCGFVAEDMAQAAGSKVACGKCQNPVTWFAVAFYVEKLVERYQATRRELDALKQQEDESDEGTSAAVPDTRPVLLKEHMQSTLVLATAAQHQPLQDWFAAKRIKTRFDFAQVDTTGFFDEAAIIIGNQYDLLSAPLEQVRYAYRQDWTWTNIELASKTPQQKQALKTALRELYGYTFFARYSYQKNKDVIGVGLQPAGLIRRFFDGGWLEWWALMHLLEFCLDQKLEFSCARGVQIEFSDEEARELDLCILPAKQAPIIVECKSGEFRAELDKYVKLRKRLELGQSRFIICNPDLSAEQSVAFGAMYGLTFVNLQTLPEHLRKLV